MASYLDRDGAAVRAEQFDGRVAGLFGLLAAFPGALRPHPHRDNALLVQVGSREIRVEAGDWIATDADGRIRTWPDDQFHAVHRAAPA